MARWNATVRLPDFPTRQKAEQYAAAEYSRSLIRVESVADEEIAREERAGRERNKRLKIEDSDEST